MRGSLHLRAGLKSLARPALVALGLMAAFSTSALAADYVVTKTADTSDGLCDADCSLREAIIAANASAGADRIVLGVGLVYTLTLGPADAPGAQVAASGDLDVTDSLTIDGVSATVDAAGIDRVFDIRGPITVALNGLTIIGGSASGFLSTGGGLYIGSGASVTLSGGTVAGNSTAPESGTRDNGGGIAVVGAFDAATGVVTRSALTVNNSVVSSNTGASGGGIVCVLCSLTLTNVTIVANAATSADGGGMASVGDASIVSVVSSAITENTVAAPGGRGGGLSVPFGTGAYTLTRTSIVSNVASSGAAVSTSGATVTATNNWWGCNAGPGAAFAGCAAAPNGTSGAVTSTPFLVLRVTAVPSTILAGAASTVVANLTFNSANTDTSGGGTIPNGISASFAGTLGTFTSPTATTLTGRATNLFTAGATVGTGNLSATVDAQTVSTTIGIGAGSTTTIQAAPADIAAVTEAVVVTATVTSVPAGTTASGTVTFKDGGAPLAACSSVSVTAGTATCTIPANTFGPSVHFFSAEYSGGAGVSPSASGSLGYVYVQCHTSATCPGIITTGVSGPGSPLVRRFTYHTRRPIDGPTAQFSAFASSFTGGVRVADADVTGDGAADVIAGTGPGVEPRVIVFNGVTGAVVRDFLPGFAGTGGVFVAAGDVDGDGMPDIIVGDGSDSTEVRVFSGASGVPVWTLTLGDPAFAGGVRVAAGDVDGDGYADLVVGSGPGSTSKVRVFGGASRAELRTWSPYGGFAGGVFVAAGDVNGDGFSDIVTGADAGGGPHVRVFNGATGAEIAGFFATDPTFTGGVRVAAGDLDGDGKADIVTGFGTGSDLVLVFNAANVPAGLGFGGDGAPPLILPPSPNGLFVSTAVPANRMVIDAPASGATVPPSFRLNGWAFEEHAPGTGVDAIHVWAYPTSGGAPIFLGAATLGDSRPDVGAIFGSRYATSGYHLDVASLADGTYDVVAFAHRSGSDLFNMRRLVRVRVLSPGADLQLAVDLPSAGSVRPNFRVAGWAFDIGGAGSSHGIEAVHVWAFPTSGAPAMFVGAASLGDARPDVAALFGSRATNAGYHLDVAGLLAGDYVLGVYAKALALPTFTVVRTVPLTVTPWAPMIHQWVDLPAPGALASGTFVVAGWALALDSPSAPGIAAVQVWAYPVGGGAPSFLGSATLGQARPDVAAIFGAAYGTSGYALTVTGLGSGTWDLAVFPLADGASAFGAAQVIRVTIP